MISMQQLRRTSGKLPRKITDVPLTLNAFKGLALIWVQVVLDSLAQLGSQLRPSTHRRQRHACSLASENSFGPVTRTLSL